jgi:hypothetical protein
LNGGHLRLGSRIGATGAGGADEESQHPEPKHVSNDPRSERRMRYNRASAEKLNRALTEQTMAMKPAGISEL